MILYWTPNKERMKEGICCHTKKSNQRKVLNKMSKVLKMSHNEDVKINYIECSKEKCSASWFETIRQTSDRRWPRDVKTLAIRNVLRPILIDTYEKIPIVFVSPCK